MKGSRTIAILAGLSLVFVACEGTPIGPDLVVEETTGLNHHRPDHAGGPGGGGEDPPPAGFELTMSGAVTTGPVATTMIKETKRRLELAIPSAQFVFTTTHAAAIDEITTPGGGICEYRPATIPLATKQALAAALQANRSDGRMLVNKFEDKGNVVFNHTNDGGLWTSWGFNIQHDDNVQQAADVTYDGTDKQDASATRHFVFGGTGLHGGFIRVLTSEGDMVCLVQDEMLAVVSP